MGMHADCGHGMIMATSMAQLHSKVMTAANKLPLGHKKAINTLKGMIPAYIMQLEVIQ